ncbi:MAG: hypothetical protein ACJ79X_05405, partial [Gemmatimonadaceae bacterium]
ALSKARRAASLVKCASNERQIGQLFFMYASFNKGMLPSYWWANGENQTWKSWDYLLTETTLKYQNRDQMANNDTLPSRNNPAWQVWSCPEDEFPRNAQPQYAAFPIRSYAVNQSKWCWGLADSGSSVHNGAYKMPWSGGCSTPGVVSTYSWLNIKSEKLSSIPSRIWLLGENYGTTSVYSMAASPNLNPSANGAVVGTCENGTLEGSPARFHGRTMWGINHNTKGLSANTDTAGGNYLSADGHVEFARYADVINIRCDTPDTGSSGNGTVLGDHWKWRPGDK